MTFGQDANGKPVTSLVLKLTEKTKGEDNESVDQGQEDDDRRDNVDQIRSLHDVGASSPKVGDLARLVAMRDRVLASTVACRAPGRARGNPGWCPGSLAGPP